MALGLRLPWDRNGLGRSVAGLQRDIWGLEFISGRRKCI